ncbi:MAG: hypothetical protein K6347_04005 [Campylobacterales bacterium]
MHGRITYFNYKNGIGLITDQHKRGFDLRSGMWHDPTTIPSVGMNVEFTLNEKGLVSSCKASLYQDFADEPFVKEEDFWHTDTDAALRELEEKRKEEIINARAKEIDLANLLTLKPNKSPEEAFKGFFYNHYKIISRNKELLESPKKGQLNYFLMKRFIEKSLTQLAFLDKRIKMEDFSAIRQEIVEVEYLYTAFVKNEKNQAQQKLDQIFLRHQIDYLAIKKAIELQKEKVMFLESQMRVIDSEIRHLEDKALAAENPQQQQEFQAKAAEKQKQRETLLRQIAQERTLQEQATKVLNDFTARYIDELPTLFAQIRQSIRNSLRKILDVQADRLDTLIWQKAMASEAVMNSFYKQEIGDPFCAMTFLRYYLMRLDRDKVSDADKTLFDYLSDYDKKQCYKFAVISENPAILRKIKLFILSGSKDHRVFTISKAVEFLGQSQQIQPHVVIVDESIKSITPVELIVESKKRVINPTTRFILFAS